ncbi:putative bifunctional diguanylate cyclase/phosphodiesterase [Nitrospira sp. Kam-Ns4a]
MRSDHPPTRHPTSTRPLPDGRWRAILEAVSEGLYGLDRGGRCTFLNEAGAAMMGDTPAALRDQNLHALLHHRPPTQFHCAEEGCPIRQALTTGRPVRVDEQIFWRRDGTALPVACTVVPLRQGDDVTGVVLACTDLTPRKQLEAQLRELARADALTGLPNRRVFLEWLPRAIARTTRTDRVGALLVIDLDRFARINDMLGQAGGDRLLQAWATRLIGCLRATDTVARLGDNEFAILLEDLLLPEEAAVIAQRLLHALAQPFLIHAHECVVTGSIGIALFSSGRPDHDTLFAHATTALHAAKAHRNTYRVFAPGMKTVTAERLALESHLRHALDRQELGLVYQPQVDVRDNRIVGVEALLRWTHPEHGVLSPHVFIGLAEDTGLMVSIGEWVVRTACQQLKAWQAHGAPPVRVGVNLSRVQLQQPQIVKTIRQILTDTDLDPRCLELEVTESLLIQPGTVAVETLHALRALGVRCVVDDFGTGYASFNYLKDLPIQGLKIDQSFVKPVTTSAKEASIVKTIMTLAQTLNLDVVAEGVETEQQRDVLRAAQCFVMQGYYFARPEPAEAVAARLVPGPIQATAL